MARRAAKRRSSRRSSHRLRRNDAPPVAAPAAAAKMSSKKKLVLGGIVVLGIGGVAAYALTSGAAPPPVPTGPTIDPRAAKQVECDALRQSLATLRAQPTPDAADMQRIEGQISACHAQLREMGVSIEAAQSHLANADASFAQIEGWFNEYRATSEHDPLKRNNARGSILNGGEAMAATYVNAITQATSPEAYKMIAQSLVRALDASISRRICFWNSTPGPGGGCGTFAVNEDQPDAKQIQERDRVTVPLLAAYARVVTKVGGPTRALADADGEKFLAAILRPSANIKAWIDGQFAHYTATDWSDALKRNNTRISMLTAGREMVRGLTDVLGFASSFGSVTSLRAIATLTIAALDASVDRWRCFYTSGPGCGTFGVNEDHPDTKAMQEMATTAVPLMALYVQVAKALTARGAGVTVRRVGMDTIVPAIEPLITSKLRICKAMNDAIGAQFAHYKATDYSDALKRNNTRTWMLLAGASLAACLQDTLNTATGAAKPAARGVSGLLGLGGYTGLGQTPPLTPMIMLSVPMMTTMPMTMFRPTAPAPSAPVASAPVAPPMVRPIATLAAAALDAAIQRKICYLHDLPGCGRFAVNEAHGNDKAAEEQARVIAPLILVLKNTALADPGSAQNTKALLVGAMIREITAENRYIDAQLANLKATDYSDGLKRTNIRGNMIAAGQRMVATLKSAAAAGLKTKQPLQTIARAALEASNQRLACYRAAAPGCDRLDDAGYGAAVFFSGGAYAAGGREDHANDKVAQEIAQINGPLGVLLADKTAVGLGGAGLGGFMDDGFAGISGYAWLGIGAVAVLAVGAYQSSKKTHRNRRRRRSSYRLAA